MSMGCAGAMEGIFGLQGCLAQMACFKRHAHECQDQEFYSRTLQCNEVINIFSSTVSGVNVIADECIVG